MLLASRLVLLLVGITFATAHLHNSESEFITRQREAAKRSQIAGSQQTQMTAKVKNITFRNPKASEFYVDGTTIPEVNFDVGPSWSGLMPISGHPDETRKLFFWFWPPGPQGSLDDLIFWTNGGPGCSSLEGLLQENGPFSWSYGQAKPTQNEYSWTNLSSILFVEQPVGTGFTQGTSNIADEVDLAKQLVGFFQQFLEVFWELKGKRFYLTGESYAGYYLPHTANYIYENVGILDLDLQGIWIGDPLLSWFVVYQQIPAVDFVHKYESVFAFNQSFMAHLDSRAKACNYAGYVAQHVTFPPKGPLPLPGNSTFVDEECNIWKEIFYAALLINPAFNIYRIFDMYPTPWDVLGFPGTFFQTQVTPVYFDRKDVKLAIHAPVNMTWSECSRSPVFVDGDSSQPSAFTVLPKVIEKNKKTVIVHGLADFQLMAEGTRIVIQNMTWAGKQGFQQAIVDESFQVDGIGAYGTATSERGLTYVEVVLCGHMLSTAVLSESRFSDYAIPYGIQSNAVTADLQTPAADLIVSLVVGLS